MNDRVLRVNFERLTQAGAEAIRRVVDVLDYRAKELAGWEDDGGALLTVDKNGQTPREVSWLADVLRRRIQ